MYLDFFSLREFPFANGCNGRFYFESDAHAEALANMVYTVRHRRGMVLITGEVGSGKTFLGAMLAERLGAEATVVMVRHPPAAPRQLLRALLTGLGRPAGPETDQLALLAEAEEHLERCCRRGQTVALVLDECQGLGDDVLEEVRRLWNCQSEGRHLLQIVLIGQPEFLDRLADPRWESLRQRIILSYHLGRLSPRATAMYVLHRRRLAARNGCRLRFTLDALKLIHRCTQGIPRLINSLCDNALLVAYARGRHKITSGIILAAAQEMTSWSLHGTPTVTARQAEALRPDLHDDPDALPADPQDAPAGEGEAAGAAPGRYVPEPPPPPEAAGAAETWSFTCDEADLG